MTGGLCQHGFKLKKYDFIAKTKEWEDCTKNATVWTPERGGGGTSPDCDSTPA